MNLKKIIGLSVVASLLTMSIQAKDKKEYTVKVVGSPVTPYKFTGSLKDLPIAKKWKSGDPIKEIPRRTHGKQATGTQAYEMSKDPLAELQKQTSPNSIKALTTPIINIDGQSFTGVNPPDPTGDIGKLYYIQSVNGTSGAEFSIYNKETGALIVGPISMESLAPATSACARGRGDPIVLYDEVAERWFMQEFVNGANNLCFYISATDDPINGGWNFYEYIGVTFPDYPHFGKWSDAYYGTANENPAKVYAFDRTNMILGNPARSAQVIELGDLPGYMFQTATPVDWDGKTLPPNNAPGIIMRHVDEEAHNTFTNNPTTDLLEMYEYHVDFDNVANSTFTQIDNIVISDFNSFFINYSDFATVPQPGSTSRLDAIREIILNRLIYRKFSNYEVIVGVLPTNIDPATTGSNVNAGLRWFELRKPTGGVWGLHQEGTYDSGVATQNRLVGSVAMDKVGNISLAYTLTDTDSANPIPASVAFTGRLSNDANDVMTQPEVIIKLGAGANGSGRWGDYASMGVDPVDGCTFWFTSEYQNGGSWGTSISSFEFDGCDQPSFSVAPSITSIDICAIPVNNRGAATYSFDIDVLPIQDYIGEITLAVETTPSFVIGGVLTPDFVTAPATSNYSFDVDATGTAGSHTITISATGVIPDPIFMNGFEIVAPPRNNRTLGGDTIINTFDVNINYSPALPVSSILNLPADNDTSVSLNPTFTWGASANALSYLIEVATDNAFLNVIDSSSTTALSYTVTSDLPAVSVLYWRVTAISPCGQNISNVQNFTTQPLPGDCAINQTQIDVVNYDFESGAQGWVHEALFGLTDSWTLQSNIVNSGTKAFNTEDLTVKTDNVLTSPVISIPNGQSPITLRFWNQQSMESRGGGCWDGGVLEVSTDGGIIFNQITTDKMFNDPYDGPLGGSTSTIAGSNAWCGDPQAGLVSRVNFDQFAGNDIQVRFRMVTDGSEGRTEGWTIDDVKITGCQ